MLAHLPVDLLMASSPTLAWIGALVLIIGETAALISLPNLARVFVISTIAELGYVLIGFGVGGPAGDTGALMHLGFQAVMRGLVLAAGWSLVRRTGSAKLDDLAGSGRRMPLTATLFGFGVFSVMGLSPFKGSFSKFIILYAAIERGLWPVALAGTLATIVAAVYYMLVVQRVCLEPEGREVALAPAPPLAMPTRLAARRADRRPQPVAGAVARIRRAPRRLPERARRAAIRLAVGRAGARPLCRRLPSLRHRPGLRASARRCGGAAGDRHRRGRGFRRKPRSGLETVRAAVLRHRGADDRLFARLHRPRGDGQPLLFLRLPDDRLADRPDHGA